MTRRRGRRPRLLPRPHAGPHGPGSHARSTIRRTHPRVSIKGNADSMKYHAPEAPGTTAPLPRSGSPAEAAEAAGSQRQSPTAADDRRRSGRGGTA